MNDGTHSTDTPHYPESECLDSQPDLWHFTCEHGRRALGKRGLLIAPVRHPLLGVKVIWLTTEAQPDRERTGLTMAYTRCDRMAYRYRVLQPDRCTPWLGSIFRAVAPLAALVDLESFGDPENWWVSAVPTLASLSLTRAGEFAAATTAGCSVTSPWYDEDGITIYHGDCRDILPGLTADVIITDPPYANGADYDLHDDTTGNLTALIADALPLMLAAAPVIVLTPGIANVHRYPAPTWILAWVQAHGSGTGRWGFNEWQPILAYGTDPYLTAGNGRLLDVVRTPRRRCRDSR